MKNERTTVCPRTDVPDRAKRRPKTRNYYTKCNEQVWRTSGSLENLRWRVRKTDEDRPE